MHNLATPAGTPLSLLWGPLLRTLPDFLVLFPLCTPTSLSSQREVVKKTNIGPGTRTQAQSLPLFYRFGN